MTQPPGEPISPSPCSTALSTVQDAAAHHNHHWGKTEGEAAVSREEDTIILRGPAGEERFTVDGMTLHGRGGSFNLQEQEEGELAIQTVMPRRAMPSGEFTGQGSVDRLHQTLLREGFTVFTSEVLRWRYEFQAWLLTAERTEADGSVTVLWLKEREAEHSGSKDLSIGEHWLSTSLDPHDEDTQISFRLTDEEQQERFGQVMPLPDALHTYGWPLQEDCLLTLIQAARDGTLHTAQPSGVVPKGFYTGGLFKQYTLSTLTREEALAAAAQERETWRTEFGFPFPSTSTESTFTDAPF